MEKKLGKKFQLLKISRIIQNYLEETCRHLNLLWRSTFCGFVVRSCENVRNKTVRCASTVSCKYVQKIDVLPLLRF